MANQPYKVRKDSFFNLYFTSTISITLVLFLIGLITLLIIGANYFANQTRENITVSVVLNHDIDSLSQERLYKYLSSAYYVKDVEHISREQALQEHVEAMGDDPSQFLGYNPLSASMELHLKSDYSHNDSIEMVESKIRAFKGVNDIWYQKDMLQLVTNNLSKLSFVLIIITLVLLFISIVLINNTIRISIYSKRFLIHTMTLVGAKPSFIRKPFLRRSFVNSCIATLLALILLGGMCFYFQQQIGSSFNLFNWTIIVPVVVVVALVSWFISWSATAMAVNRYLRMRSSQLFYI